MTEPVPTQAELAVMIETARQGMQFQATMSIDRDTGLVICGMAGTWGEFQLPRCRFPAVHIVTASCTSYAHIRSRQICTDHAFTLVAGVEATYCQPCAASGHMSRLTIVDGAKDLPEKPANWRAWWRCPVTPECPHPSSMHEPEAFVDQDVLMECLAVGCGCRR